MNMTSDTLYGCLALAAIGAVVSVLALRWLMRTPRRRQRMTGYLLATALLLTTALLWIDIVILWCLIEYGLLDVDLTAEGLRALMARADPWAPLISIALMAAHSLVPFPAEIIAIANGLVFGPWLGILITWLGAMIGAILSYEIARGLGPAARSRLVPQRYHAKIDAFTNHIGIAALLAARLVPLISFNLVNYTAGLCRVPRLMFFWTTGVGILPLTVLSVLLGSEALRLPLYIWIPAGALLLLFFIATRVIRHVIATNRQAAPKPRSTPDDRHADNIP